MEERELGRWVEPEAAFLALCSGESEGGSGAAGSGRADVAWLDSGPDAAGGLSIIGWPLPGAPRLRAERATDAAPMLAALKTALDASPPGSGLFPMWLGWFGHEFGSALLGVPFADAEPVLAEPVLAEPVLAEAVLIERAVVFDHAERTVRIVAGDGDHAWAEAVLRILRGTPAAASGPPASCGPVEVTRAHDDAAYLELIRRCLAHIAAGDAYQLCLTEQWSLPRPADPLAVYRRLRRLAPSHHGGYLRLGGRELLSASPERFVEVRDGLAITRPMKGTRPRGSDADLDAALAAELRASEKEQAENLMIVDLVRNDLSKAAELGSVTVEELFGLESYRTVHQLVSTVTARLAPGRTAVDAFAALFPAGSMTGAPKRRAVELLRGLEGVPRGAYAGAFGYFAADGSADFATVIRTMVVEGEWATIGAGGGITASSDPEAELAEMKLKAAALLRAL